MQGPKKELQSLLASEGLLGAGTGWNVTAPPDWQEMDWIHSVMYQAFYDEVVKQPADLLNIAAMEKKYRCGAGRYGAAVQAHSPSSRVQLNSGWLGPGADGGTQRRHACRGGPPAGRCQARSPHS